MDIAIATLKKHESAVLDAVSSPYSNGSLEGIDHLIKLWSDPASALGIS